MLWPGKGRVFLYGRSTADLGLSDEPLDVAESESDVILSTLRCVRRVSPRLKSRFVVENLDPDADTVDRDLTTSVDSRVR